VGLGCVRLGLSERPTSIAGKQAAAAVGQGKLMGLWDDFFSVLGHAVAQVLLTYENFGDRNQYTNARNAFLELMRLGVIPIVNENDTVAVQELRVGDNDTLSALVAGMVGARWLLLLTDVEGLFEADPRKLPSAGIIRTIKAEDIYGLRRQMEAGRQRLVPGDTLTPAEAAPAHPPAAAQPSPPGSPQRGGAGASSPTGGVGTAFGTGGMATKLKAAQLAAAAGTTTVIMTTSRVELVVEALSGCGVGGGGGGGGESSGAGGAAGAGFVSLGLGTVLQAVPAPVVAGPKRWVLSVAPSGTLLLDDGAVAAIKNHKSLFSAGIWGVEGCWDAQEAVALVSRSDGKEVGRALVNYSSAECAKLKGLQSAERKDILGYEGPEAVADRGLIVVL